MSTHLKKQPSACLPDGMCKGSAGNN